MLNILNLYAGLGGNRRLWEGVSVTAVEWQEDIAGFYRDTYPRDTVIVGDAHQYLLEHYKEFDFIWASPPCPSHSRARFWSSRGGRYAPVYPDMKLYEEILFLQHYFEGTWIIENVTPFYEPLVSPSAKLGRHLFWCNFPVQPFHANDADIRDGNRGEWQEHHQVDLSGYSFHDRTDKILRNCVDSRLGLHLLECSYTTSPSTVAQAGLF
jgi:DNA (cytosine-5)-methyltransferase 1